MVCIKVEYMYAGKPVYMYFDMTIMMILQLRLRCFKVFVDMETCLVLNTNVEKK